MQAERHATSQSQFFKKVDDYCARLRYCASVASAGQVLCKIFGMGADVLSFRAAGSMPGPPALSPARRRSEDRPKIRPDPQLRLGQTSPA